MTEAAVSFAGDLTHDPELRRTEGGIARAMVRVAVSAGGSRSRRFSPWSCGGTRPSMLWRSKSDQSSQQKLVGVTPVLTYITLAEWWQWAHHRGCGPAKISEMRTYASNFELLHCGAIGFGHG